MPALAVIGARAFIYRDRLWAYLDKVLAAHGKDLMIVSGACPKGADAFAEEWAKREGVPLLLFPANWKTGKGAGFARNSRIVEASDAVAAFLQGPSRGTLNSIETAWKLGKKVLVSTEQHPSLTEVKNFAGLAIQTCDHLEAQRVELRDGGRNCLLCDKTFK